MPHPRHYSVKTTPAVRRAEGRADRAGAGGGARRAGRGGLTRGSGRGRERTRPPFHVSGDTMKRSDAAVRRRWRSRCACRSRRMAPGQPIRRSRCASSCRSPPAASPTRCRASSARSSPQKWGQPVSSTTRPGASGNIGMAEGARAEPDGYTLVLAPAGNLTVNPTLFRNLPFDTLQGPRAGHAARGVAERAGRASVGAGEDFQASWSPTRRRTPASSTSRRRATAAARTSPASC